MTPAVARSGGLLRDTRPGPSALLSGALIVGLSLASILLDGPPSPKPASAPATMFSAGRAMAHVERIAQRPHPLGSADHARVRDYLVTVLEKLGLTVVRQATVVRRGTTAIRMARVENLMARITGAESTGAVLLAAHYDSVPAAPGAADDGSGVAALLEAARALKDGPPLRNDVIVLFTDGEELGLLGASAFVEQHPWAKDVRMLLNFEARGSSGPAYMFETSAGNGAIVADWASTVPRPAGWSLTYEVYKRLPNDTDFSEFKKLRAAGLNFAFLGDPANYHTPRDSVATLDRGSLQQHGEAALSLARRFGSVDLASLQAPDAVYFWLPILNVTPRYSGAWAVPLAAAASVLFLVVVVRARRRREASVGGLVLAALIVGGFTGASGYLGWRFGRLVSAFHQRWLTDGNVLASGPYAASMVAGIIVVWLVLYVLLRKKFAAHTIALGALLVWVLAALASSWFLVGGSYALVWPLVGGACSVMALSTGRQDSGVGPGRAALLSLLAVPAILILWPLAHAFFSAMGLSPEGGAAMGTLAALGVGVLAIQSEAIVERRRWWPSGIALLAALVSLVIAMMATRYSDEHPKPVNMLYVMDADARKAHWTTSVDRPDVWLQQYLGTAPRNGRPQALVPPWSSVTGIPGYLNGDAPAVDLLAPQARLLASIPAEGGRTVTFRASPAREGDDLSVWVNGASTLDAAIDGISVPGPIRPRAPDDTAWSLGYVNAPVTGVTIALTLKGLQPLTVAVVERRAGLPSIPGMVFTPRPASRMPVGGGDQTMVRRSYTF